MPKAPTTKLLDASLGRALAVLRPDAEPAPPQPATLADVVLLLDEILREVRALRRDVRP